MEPMETTEWMTVPQASDERQQSARYLAIEVRIYEEDGTLYAEPVYYKLMEDGTSAAAILMDGSYASREADRMWNYIRLLVEGEYTADVLADIREWHPTFAPLRYEDRVQKRMDNEWYRRSVL